MKTILPVEMKSAAVVLLAFLSWIFGQAIAAAVTVSAGTTIVVQTVDTLSAHASRGKTFKAKLARDLEVDGKTVLPAGTIVVGIVESSRSAMKRTTTEPLTVDLRTILFNGRKLSIKTTGAVEPATAGRFSSLERRTGVGGGRSVLQTGTQLQFQLAEPLNL